MSRRKLPNAKSTLVQFTNCRILFRGNVLHEDLWVRDGIIQNPEKIFFDEKIASDIQIDCQNFIISPGFIDVQINGGFGCDFSSSIDELEEGISTVAKGLLQFGVTSFCPTLVTSPAGLYKEALPKIKRRKGGKHGAEVLGIHLEGPFINRQKKGAHNPDHIQDQGHAGIGKVSEVYGPLHNVSLVTVAPEIPGILEAIPELVKEGIVVSMGHCVANLVQGEEAARKGTTFITHLFNAMSPFHHRDPGVVGVLTSYVIPSPIFYGLIADGIHTHDTALRIAHRACPQGLVLISDAMAAMGLPPGRHKLGTMEVDIKNRKAMLVGTDTLAGSIVTMDKCVRHFRKAAGCTTVEALEAATLHPAQLLKIDQRKGTLEYGTDADFVFLDDKLTVHATFIAGMPVYLNHGSVKDSLDGLSVLS